MSTIHTHTYILQRGKIERHFTFIVSLKISNILFKYSSLLSELLNQSFIGTPMRKKVSLNLAACLITLMFKNETQSWRPL